MIIIYILNEMKNNKTSTGQHFRIAKIRKECSPDIIQSAL